VSPLVEEDYGTTSATSSVNSGDVITSADDAMLLSFLMLSLARTTTVPTGYTAIDASGVRGRAAYRAVPAADTYSAVWNWTGGSAASIALHEAYRAEPAAVPTISVITTLRSRGLNRGVN
jgi:hypothetical protein